MTLWLTASAVAPVAERMPVPAPATPLESAAAAAPPIATSAVGRPDCWKSAAPDASAVAASETTVVTSEASTTRTELETSEERTTPAKKPVLLSRNSR